MEFNALFLEIDSLTFIENLIFEVHLKEFIINNIKFYCQLIQTNKKGHLKFKLIQHTFLMLLYELMNLFSIKYIAIIILLDKLFQMNLYEAIKTKDYYNKFLRLNEEIRKFINSHQFIQGFQISTKEFYSADSRTKIAIDDYISILTNNSEENPENIYEIKEIEIDDLEEEGENIKEEPIKIKETLKDSLDTTANDCNLEEISENSNENKNLKMKSQLKRVVGITSKDIVKAVILEELLPSKHRKNGNNLNSKIPILSVLHNQKNQLFMTKKIDGEKEEDKTKNEKNNLVVNSYEYLNNCKDLNLNKKLVRKFSTDFEPDFHNDIFECFVNKYSTNI